MLAIVTSHPIQNQAPLWRALAAAGVKFEVWFLTPHAVKQSHDEEFGRTFAWDVDLLAGYPHRFLSVRDGWQLSQFNGIKLQRRWANELRESGVTTLWLEGWRFRTLWQAAAAAHRAGIPIWLRGESHDLAPISWSRRIIKRFFLHRLFRQVHRFLCIGSANQRFYRAYGVAGEKLASAPYCVDNARFAQAAESARSGRAAQREHWSIPADAYVVLFCGKFIAKKHPLDLLEAGRSLPELAGRPVHFLFVGDGELAGTMQQQMNIPGAPRGTCTGFLNQSEIPNAFAAADCLVLPSDYGETWGLVANEALASGLPVIASDRCGCAEDLAAPLGLAHVYPCGDIPKLCESLRHVATSPPAPVTLRTLIEKFSPERTAATVVALLAQARDTGRRQP